MSRRKQPTSRLLSSGDDSSDVTSTGAGCADSMLAKRRRSLGDDFGSSGSEKKLKGSDKLQHSDAESDDCDTVSQSSPPPSLTNGRTLDADQLSTDEGDLIVDLDDEDYEERRTPTEVDSNQKICLPDGSKSQRVFPYDSLNMLHSSSESLQAIMAKAQLSGKTGEGRETAGAGLPTADLVFLQTMLSSLQQQQFAQLQLIQHIQHQLLANGQSQSQLALSSATSSSILSSSTSSSYYSPQRHMEHFPENKLAPADNRSTIEPSRHDNSYMAMDSGETRTCAAEAASPSSIVDLQQQHLLHSSSASIPPHVTHIPAQPLVSTSFQPRTVPSLQPTGPVLSGQQQEVSDADDMQVMKTLPSIAGPAAGTTTSMLEQLVQNMEAKLPDSNQCVVCQRVLSCRSALQMHYRTHTGERPYHCKLCGRMFTTKGNLKTHMSVHLHYCPVCHKQFINDGTLHQHDSMHTSCTAVGQHGLSPESKAVSTSAPLSSLSVAFLAAPPSLATSSVMQLPYGRIAYPFLLPSQPLPLVRSPVDQLYTGCSSPSATDGECKELDLRVHKLPQPDEDDQKKKSDNSQDDSSTQALPPLELMENIVRRTQADDLALTSARRLQPPVGLAAVISPQDTAIENMSFAAACSGDRADILLPGNRGNNANYRVCLDNYNTATVPSASSAFVPFSKAPVISDVNNHLMSNVMEASKSSRALATCSVCMKVFACRSALDIHYRSHTKERPYRCHVCHRAFSTRGNMKQHLLTHKTSRLPPKDICQQQEGYHLIADPPAPVLLSSSRLSALRSDVGTPLCDRIEPSSGARSPAAVEVDNESSASAGSSAPSPVPHTPEKVINAGTSLVSSKNHVTTSTPSKPSSSLSTLSASSSSSGRRVAQKHTCQVCEKPFSSASALQIHMRTHTGDKPFACTVCSKSFTTKGNLKVHMSTHKWFTRPSRRGRRSSIDLDNLGQGQSQPDYFGAFPRATRPLLGADGRFFPFLPLPPAPGFSPFARGDAGIGSSVFHPHANIPISMTSVGMLGLSRPPYFTQQLDGGRICSSPKRSETEVLSPRREAEVSYYQREQENSRAPVALTTNRHSSQSPQSPVTAQSSDCDSGHYSPSTVHSGSSGELDLSMKKRRSSSPSVPGTLAGDTPSSISSSANSSRSSSADDGKRNVTSPYQPPNLMHLCHTWQL